MQAGEKVRLQRGETWQPAEVLQKHELPISNMVCTPYEKLYRRNKKYLCKTDESTFPSVDKQNTYLKLDSGLKDCDTGERQATYTHLAERTVNAAQKET